MSAAHRVLIPDVRRVRSFADLIAAPAVITFRLGSLIVDVSCDEGMGFSWAVPTTFDEPMFTVADRVHYYAVDHSPSYLWNSATWENSEALLGYLPVVMGGPEAWDADETIRRAVKKLGENWKRAKKWITSPDPQYEQKRGAVTD